MKKKLIILFLSVFSTLAFSQSADYISKVLESKEATYGQIGYLVSVCQGFVLDSATEDEALDSLFKNGQISGIVQSDKVLRYDEAAALFSKVWKIRSNLMYLISNGSSRYAFKQLKSDGVIPKNVDPKDSLSGEELLNIFTAGNLKYGE